MHSWILLKLEEQLQNTRQTSFTYINVLWRTRYRTIVAILTCKWSGRVFCNLAKLFEGQRGYEPRSSRCRWICYLFSCTINTLGIYRALLFYVIIASASATIAGLPAKLNSAQRCGKADKTWVSLSLCDYLKLKSATYLRRKLFALKSWFLYWITETLSRYFMHIKWLKFQLLYSWVSPNYFQYTQAKICAMHSQNQVLRTGWLLIL